MSKLILISHGEFSKELLNSSEMILGKIEDAQTVCLYPQEGPEDFKEKLDKAISNCGEEEIVILADLLGGTPCNVAVKCALNNKKISVFAGMNLPMIISYVNSELTGMPLNVVDNGKEAIVNVLELFNNITDDEDE